MVLQVGCGLLLPALDGLSLTMEEVCADVPSTVWSNFNFVNWPWYLALVSWEVMVTVTAIQQ